jgi:CO/xanthine dehydrogenase FAD-binding subunit
MPQMAYAAPTTVKDAVAVLASAAGLAKVMSGGTDLLVQLRTGRVSPALIDDGTIHQDAYDAKLGADCEIVLIPKIAGG